MRGLVAVVVAAVAVAAAEDSDGSLMTWEVAEERQEPEPFPIWANAQDLCNPIIAELEDILQRTGEDDRLILKGEATTNQRVSTGYGNALVKVTLRGMNLYNVGDISRQRAGKVGSSGEVTGLGSRNGNLFRNVLLNAVTSAINVELGDELAGRLLPQILKKLVADK